MNSKIIPYGKHNVTQDDLNAVVEVLKSDYLTQGPKILEFEKEFAKYVGSKYAVAVSNGTEALHLCNIALGVKKVDKVYLATDPDREGEAISWHLTKALKLESWEIVGCFFRDSYALLKAFY